VPENTKKDGSKEVSAKARKRIIYFKNEIKDHINNMKWQNSAFIKLNENFIVQEQSMFDYTKLEARGQGANNGAGGGLFYSG
jgi:hypothetical protein